MVAAWRGARGGRHRDCGHTALLEGADAIGLTTARGGLLRLLKDLAARAAPHFGLGDIWSNIIAPATTGDLFRNGFHIVVGLLMALFYAYVLEPILPGKALVKGLIYALIVWLLNAFVVLPAIGEGIAGSRYLGLPGMIGFAVIHTVFFVLLAALYTRFRSPAHSI
jgi:hypothetical protein